MFVKLTEIQSAFVGKPVELDIMVNVNHVVKVAKLPKSGVVRIILTIGVSLADGNITVKGEFDEIVAKLCGKNPGVTVGAVDD